MHVSWSKTDKYFPSNEPNKIKTWYSLSSIDRRHKSPSAKRSADSSVKKININKPKSPSFGKKYDSTIKTKTRSIVFRSVLLSRSQSGYVRKPYSSPDDKQNVQKKNYPSSNLDKSPVKRAKSLQVRIQKEQNDVKPSSSRHSTLNDTELFPISSGLNLFDDQHSRKDEYSESSDTSSTGSSGELPVPAELVRHPGASFRRISWTGLDTSPLKTMMDKRRQSVKRFHKLRGKTSPLGDVGLFSSYSGFSEFESELSFSSESSTSTSMSPSCFSNRYLNRLSIDRSTSTHPLNQNEYIEKLTARLSVDHFDLSKSTENKAAPTRVSLTGLTPRSGSQAGSIDQINLSKPSLTAAQSETIDELVARIDREKQKKAKKEMEKKTKKSHQEQIEQQKPNLISEILKKESPPLQPLKVPSLSPAPPQKTDSSDLRETSLSPFSEQVSSKTKPISITKKSGSKERPKSSKRPVSLLRAQTPNRSQRVSNSILEFHRALLKYMKNHGFFSEFPSPTLLNKAAEEYKTLEINWPEDDDGVLCPCPPRSTRKDILDNKRMIEMDKQALNTPVAFLKRPLFEVVQYLIEPAQNEVEMARAMFRWITAQDLDDIKVDQRHLNAYPDDYACVLLDKIRKSEIQYSDVFGEMASYANIECVKITGAYKVMPEKPNPTVCNLKEWTWVSLFLEGDWRFVDCHLGAIYWKQNRRKMVSESKISAKRSKESIDINLEILPSFLNEFCFVTAPEDMILSHFPNKEYWQLLPRTVNYSEFINMPFITPEFLFFSIQASGNERLGVMAQKGEAVLNFTYPETISLIYTYRLRKIAEDTEDSQEFHEFAFLENNYKKHFLKISFKLPEIGKYIFDLLGTNDTEKTNTRMSHLCSYLIECTELESRFEGFPRIELLGWGPASETESIGLIPVSHFNGLIYTVDGKVEIVFTLRKRLIFEQTLTVKYSIDESSYMIRRTENDQVIFLVTPPNHIDYYLQIYAKLENEQTDFRNVCNYLIRCPEVLELPAPFPKVAKGCVGVKQECCKLGLTLISPQSAVIYAPESGSVSIRFIASKPIVLVPELYHCNISGRMEDTAECVVQSRSGSRVTLNSELPKPGLFYFSLRGKNPNDEDGFVEVYNAVIYCNWPSKQIVIKPTFLSDWKSNYTLNSPKLKHLPATTNVEFSLNVPTACGVIVRTQDEIQHLDHQKGESLWEKSVYTGLSGKDSSSLRVEASFEKHSKTYLPLIEFQVISHLEIKRMHDAKEENFYRAIQRINHLKKDGKWRPPPKQPDVSVVDDDESIPHVTLDRTDMTMPIELSDEDEIKVKSDTSESSESEMGICEWKKKQRKVRKEDNDRKLNAENYKIRVSLMRSRLKDNVARRDKRGLKSAITDAQMENIAMDSEEYAQADRMMALLILRDEMMYYLDVKDEARAQHFLSVIEKRGFAADIPKEVARAKAVLKHHQKKPLKREYSGIISIPALAEINRYRQPTDVVHQVFSAILLLMGVHEGITKKWKKCQKICVAIGSVGMNKRVHHLNVKDIHPQIASRAREIIECLTKQEAEAVGPGIGALYKWIKQVIDEVLAETEDPDNPVVPAKKKLQKKLLKENTFVESLGLVHTKYCS